MFINHFASFSFTQVLRMTKNTKCEKCKEQHFRKWSPTFGPQCISRYESTNSVTSEFPCKAHVPCTSWHSKKLLPTD